MASKNLHLMMTADSKQAESSLSKFTGMLQTLQSRTAGLRQGLGALVGGADPFQTLKGTAQNLVSEIPGIGPALSSGMSIAEGFLNKIRDTQKGIADQGKAAIMTGSSIEGYSRLLFASGGNAEFLDKALFHLSESAGKAAIEGGESATAFERLGIDVQQFASLSADKQFLVWAAALKKVENNSERAALAQKTMGKTAKEAMFLVNKGPDWIQKRGDVAERTGALTTAADVAAVQAANAAVRDLNDSLDGTWKRLAVQLAPTVKSVADDFAKMAANNKVGQGGDDAMSLKFLRIKNQLSDSYDLTMKLNAAVLGQGDPRSIWASAKDLATGGAGKRAIEEMAKFKEDTKKATKELEEQARQQALLIKQEKERADADRELQRIQAENQKVIASTFGPLDTMLQKFQEIEIVRQRGVLTEEQYAIALSRTFDTATKGIGQGPASKAPEIAESGTAAESGAVSRAQAAVRDQEEAAKSVGDKIDALKNAQREDARRALDEVKQIRQGLEKLGIAKF